MSDDMLKELQSVKELLHMLQVRIAALEQRLGQPTRQTSTPLPTLVSAARPAPVPPVVSVRPSAPAPALARSASLEARIGRDWLNRIGIAALVLGVAFFILYTFQYLGPWAKLAIGLAVGAALVGGGVWLERRPALQWYARGLIGGGWAVLYFTVYAMHHLPAVRVLPSALADLCLLAVIAAGATWQSLKYRSQAITALALLLGFLTTCISDVTYFTLASSALLVTALAWLVVRLAWERLFVYGVAVSYVTYLLWIGPRIAFSRMIAFHVPSVTEAEFWLKAGFLGLYWAVYHLAGLVLSARKTVEQRQLVTAMVINGLAFVWGTLLGMDAAYREWRYLVPLLAGMGYLACAAFARRRSLTQLSDASLLLGLAFVTLAIPLKLSGRWISLLWMFEVPLLAWIGLRQDRWAYRVVAMVVGAMVGLRFVFLDFWHEGDLAVGPWMVPWRLWIGGLLAVAYGCTAVGYRGSSVIRRGREASAFHVYGFAAALVLWLVTMAEATRLWIGGWWAVEAAALVALGWCLHDRAFRIAGALSMMAAGASIALMTHHDAIGAGMSPSARWPMAISIVLAYGIARAYRRLALNSDDLEWSFRATYAAGATFLLTEWLWADVRHEWLSVALSLEGLALVAVGFVGRDRVLRSCGLGVFAVLILKILFVDMAGAETAYRILSFIAAGLVLLAVSYAYARWMGKSDANTNASDADQ